MKFVLAFLVLIAGVTALPQHFVAPRFPVVDHVVDFIVAFSERIRERGLDPFIITEEKYSYALPVPVIFNAAALIKGLHFHGLSNIVINSVDFDFATSILNFDLAIPHIHLSAELVQGEVAAFNKKVNGEVFGSIDVRGISFKGDVLFSMIPGSILAESAEVDLSMENIESATTLNIGTYNLSDRVNNFINIKVPDALKDFKNEVDQLLAIYTVRYLNQRHDD